MWFYSNEDECKLTSELIEIFKNSVKFFDVKKILDHKIENGDLFVLIWWKGFVKGDATWERYLDLKASIPGLLDTYFNELEKEGKIRCNKYMGETEDIVEEILMNRVLVGGR